VFIAEQLAAFGVGDLLLIAWPDLAHRSWPLSIVGGLVEEGCLLLVLGVYALAAPRLVDWSGLHVPGLRWTAWRPIVVAALRDALAHSANAATVRISQQVGIDSVAAMARRVGITSPLAEVPSLALGSSEVTPIELVTGYAPFARLSYNFANTEQLLNASCKARCSASASVGNAERAAAACA